MATTRSACRRRAGAAQPRGALLPRPHPDGDGLDGLERPSAGRGGPARRGATGCAAAITLPDDPGAERQAPAPLLRREFDARGDVASGAAVRHLARASTRSASTARRSATSSSRPGWTTYRHRLLAETYDVTRCCDPGANVIGATLGDGWYRGRLGWDREDDRCRYGDELGAHRPARGRARDGTTPRDRDATRPGGPRPARSGRADLYDGSVIDLRLRRPAGTVPGFDDERLACRSRVVPFDRRVIEPRIAPPVRVVADLPVERVGRPGRRASASTAARTSRASSGCASGAGRRPRDRAPRRGAGARRLAPHPVAALRQGDRHLHPRRRRRRRAGAGLHVPRVPATPRSRPTAEVLERDVRRHQQRHAAPRPRSRAPTRGSTGCTRTSSGRSATTSCRCRPTARSATSASAGPVTPRRSRRPLARCSTRRRSGRAGCATSRSTRTTCSACPRSCPTSCSTGEPRFGRAGWADAATIVPWAVYESYGDADDPARPARQHAALGRLARGAAGAGRAPGAGHAVRRLARPRRPGRTGRGRPRPTPTSSPTRSSPTARALPRTRPRSLGDDRVERRVPRASRTASPRRDLGALGRPCHRRPRRAARSRSGSDIVPGGRAGRGRGGARAARP